MQRIVRLTFILFFFFLNLKEILDELQTATIERLINENGISQQLLSNIYRFGDIW